MTPDRDVALSLRVGAWLWQDQLFLGSWGRGSSRFPTENATFPRGGEYSRGIDWDAGWDGDIQECSGVQEMGVGRCSQPVPILLPSRWCHWTGNAGNPPSPPPPPAASQGHLSPFPAIFRDNCGHVEPLSPLFQRDVGVIGSRGGKSSPGLWWMIQGEIPEAAEPREGSR